MQFAAPAEHYDRFMGCYLPALAPALADAEGVTAGMRAVDVGCGPGGLTCELAARVGWERVAAIAPAPQFAEVCRARNPEADIRVGVAEELPRGDAEFDVALSSLVVGFMQDPDRGVAEMARVTRPGGTVAACMWDLEHGGMTMLRIFWTAMRRVAHGVRGESRRPGRVHGIRTTSGSRSPTRSALPARRSASCPRRTRRVREVCRAELPDGSFGPEARAWFARGQA